MLADGFGPLDAATSYATGWVPYANPELTRIAEHFAPDHRESAVAIITRATHAFPGFEDMIMALCR